MIAQLLTNWGIIHLGKYLHSKHLLSEIFTVVSPQQVSGTKILQRNNLTVMQGLFNEFVCTEDEKVSQNNNLFLVGGLGLGLNKQFSKCCCAPPQHLTL